MSRQASKLPPAPSPVIENFRAEVERVGIPRSVIARGIGTSEIQVFRWWRGSHTPTWRSVERIAAYFGREPEWFYARHGEQAA